MEKEINKWLSVLLPIFVLSMPGKSLANQKPEEVALQEKMPVIINKGYVLLEKNEAAKLLSQSGLKENNLGVVANDKVAVSLAEKDEIDYGKISRLVSKIRHELCAVNQEGGYEVWLQVEGGLSGVFVSASAQTGIKAIINCSPDGKRK
ncbi:MAG: hypothetical protein K2Y08_07195 [Alphaproteobacteria bacterium]|jgi:hypothetical protein|nr:hypothetical protein [Alphaproteobacteria bacterium]